MRDAAEVRLLRGRGRRPATTSVPAALVAGAVEDLLPFSNETMVRTVADARTPVVSAIGHDVDSPLLDLVADVRASTPTDAAKLICPDAAQERAGVVDARTRARAALVGLVARERRGLVHLTSRPVLTDRTAFVRAQREVVTSLRRRAHGRVEARLHRERDHIGHLRSQARVLSPASTLERGYAIVQRPEGEVVASRAALAVDDLLRVTVADGDFAVRVTDS